MNIYGRYHTASHVGVLLGIYTFCVADPSPGLALLATVLVAGSWALFKDTVISPLPRWAINLLLLGATANLIRMAIVSPSPLTEVAIIFLGQYLICLQLIKLFETRTPRDQAQLLVLNVMLVIGAVLTSVTLQVGVMLMLYVPAFLHAVLLYHLYAGQHGTMAQKSKPVAEMAATISVAGPRTARDVRRTTGIATGIIGVGAVVVFVVMPRDLGSEFFGSVPEPVAGAASGFSDSVQLGLSGLVSESRDIVMEFDLFIDGKLANTPVNQYLRGTVLDRYDPGTCTWDRSNALKNGDARNANMLRYDRRGRGKLPAPRYSNTSTEQVYRVINKRTDHLFALWRPDQAACEKSEAIYLNPADATLRMPHINGLVTYRVRSYPYPVLNPVAKQPEAEPRGVASERSRSRDERSRRREYHRRLRSSDDELFIERPPDDVFKGTGVERYARDLMAEAGLERTPDGRNDRLILQLFERRLHADFTYTLDLLPPPDDVDPLEYFLNDTKAGHCEYFASAMAAMGQAVGIQTRVVTGFVTNEIDPTSGSYIVRKSHAHAWVQGLVQQPIDDLGDGTLDVRYVPTWERFDPTPPSQLSARVRQPGGFVAWVRRLVERVEQLWVRGVIAYNADQQKTVLHSTGFSALGLERLVRLLSGFRRPSGGGLLVFVTTAIVVFVVLLSVLLLARLALIWAWRRFAVAAERWWLARTNPTEARRLRQIDLYERMLHVLQRAGLPKPTSLPPLAFARSIEPAQPTVAASVARLADLYYAVRFGRLPLTPQYLEDAERELAALQDALRTSASHSP